jgi:hypothetical protein
MAGSLLEIENITVPTDVPDQGRFAFPVHLTSQAPEMDVHHVAVGLKCVTPDILQKHRARHGPTRPTDEIFEQLQFAGQQVKRSTAAGRCASKEIEIERPGDQARVSRLVGTTQQSLNPGNKFDQREWFGKVIVTTGSQATNTIVKTPERAEHERGRTPIVLAKPLDHVQPFAVWQLSINDQKINAVFARNDQPRLDPVPMCHAIAAGAKLQDNLVRGSRVVLDEQNVRHGRQSLAGVRSVN